MGSPLYMAVSGVLAVLLLILLISRFKVHPFLALMGASIALGLANGLGVKNTVDAFTDGFGSQLSVTGVVIALGAILGALLVQSGAAVKLADVVIGKRKLSWMPISVGVVALLIGLPNLFEMTFVLLIPLVFSIAQRLRIAPLAVGIPMAAGLMTAHGLLPPGPAPILAASAYGASIGLTTLYGAILAVPVLLVGALLLPKLMGKSLLQITAVGFNNLKTPDQGTSAPQPRAPQVGASQPSALQTSTPLTSELGGGDAPARTPHLGAALLVVLIAPVLMIIGTLTLDGISAHAPFHWLWEAMANPILTLSITVVLAFFLLGGGTGMSLEELQSIVRASFVPIVSLLLIIGAGGGLKNMLAGVGLSDMVASLAEHWAIPAVLFAWIVAAIFRLALGSGTVAVTATSGILATLVHADPSLNPALLVLATCTGAMIFSHVSDGAFWIFKEYFGLSVPQTLRTWSLLVSVQAVVGLLGVVALGAVVGGAGW